MKFRKENWESIRKRGFLNFFLIRGLLLFGLPFTLIQIFMKWQDGKYYDKVTIELFGSGDTGTKIRNAVTGAKTPYLVGSLNEDLFFKVMDASGNKGRRDSLLLFYDSPEQYENHNFIILDQNIKESWLNKNVEARKRLKIV